MKRLLPLAVLLVLTGCAGVPTDKISFNPATGLFDVESKKDIKMEDVEVTRNPNGTFSLKMKSLVATNSPDTIASVANSNAQMGAQYLQGLSQLGKITGDLEKISSKVP